MAGRRLEACRDTAWRVAICAAGGAAFLTACGPAPDASDPAPPAAPAPSGQREAPFTAEVFGLPVTRTFACANGVRLSVRITQDPHRAEVSADGAIPALLDGVVSGSGARFEKSGMSFHTKGSEALWGDFLKEETRCVEQAE